MRQRCEEEALLLPHTGSPTSHLKPGWAVLLMSRSAMETLTPVLAFSAAQATATSRHGIKVESGDPLTVHQKNPEVRSAVLPDGVALVYQSWLHCLSVLLGGCRL